MNVEKIYQIFILGTGNLDLALKNGLGGVIFFSKDIESENTFKQLTKNILNNSKIPPFLAIDQEGGRVERTEKIYKKRLSAKFAYEKGNRYLMCQTSEMAKELNNLNINLNFAPCIDVNTNPNNPIIGERSFSNNPDDVIKGGKIVTDIYKKHNIISCLKHYPGHGDADADSHKTLPKIDLPLNIMEEIHIKPFRILIENKQADMIMAGHLHCTCFDKETIPTSLSPNAISYLRNTLNYEGVLISDDMVMKGIEYDVYEACIMGIKAGLDMFIFREANDFSLNVIEQVIKQAEKDMDIRHRIDSSYKRIISLKKKYNIL